MPTVLEALNQALQAALQADECVYLLGEDILDPYGGAFKVTRGLSSAFPGRVLTTPVSEAGIVGVATGMALRGLRPVVEIMFGDFTTLIADQVINSAAKFRWMYNDQVRVPLVIRTPMGGRRGYGPTHSQSLEKLFLGVPGLRTLAPCTFGDPGALLSQAILQDDDPVLFVEHKLLYPLEVRGEELLAEFDLREWRPGEPPSGTASGALGPDYAATYRLTLRGAPPPALTLAAYGHVAELGRQAALQLAYEHEVFVELVVPTQLSPFQIEPILDATSRSGRLLAIEEGSLSLGWGAEVLARVNEARGAAPWLTRRLAARETPIPAAPALEQATLPGVTEIVQAALNMVHFT